MSRLSAAAELLRLVWDIWRAASAQPMTPRVTPDDIRRDLADDDRRAAARRRAVGDG